MNVPEEFERLLRPRCRFLPADAPLPPDEPLSALGVDSLEIVELIVDIEDAFGIEFSQDLLTPEVFVSAGSIWTAVHGLLTPHDDLAAVEQ